MSVENRPARSSVNDPFSYLYSHQYVQLTTFRKNGVAVPTPVWFADDHGKLYVMTPSGTGKIKRLRNDGRVLLVPCTAGGKVLGEPVEAQAHELSASSSPQAEVALRRKYGFLYRVFIFFQIVRQVKRAYIEIAAV